MVAVKLLVIVVFLGLLLVCEYRIISITFSIL